MENKTTRKIRNLCKYIHKALLPELSEDFHIDYSDLLRERDTSDIWRQFAIWLLVDSGYGVIRFTNPGTPQYNAINRIAQLYIEDCKDADAWKAAKDTAWYDAADAAEDAAWSAAKAAYYASGSAFYATDDFSAAAALLLFVKIITIANLTFCSASSK